MTSGKRGSSVQFGDKCKSCDAIISKENGIIKGIYLQPRCRDCQYIHTNRVPSRSKEARMRQYVEWRYDLTPNEFDKKLELQLNGCAICKQPCSTGKRLAIDHNHKTNIIRDLLCNRCNNVLGMVKEDDLLLSDMIEYLKKHEVKVA